MIAAFALGDWVSLVGAVIWFNGIGYAVISFLPTRLRLERVETVALIFSLTISVWSLLLAWLYPLKIEITSLFVFGICGLGWTIGLVRRQPWRYWRQVRHVSLGESLLWLSLVMTAATSLWAVREQVTGLGSDSYHHTLIVNMILARGRLPDDFQPYAPTLTFTYHFAFHGVVAAMAWLTGFKPVILTLAVGQGFMAAAALAVAFFTQVMTRSSLAAAISAIVTGLISVFPAFFVNWGRYTQLTGLILLPVFIGLIWQWIEAGAPHDLIAPLGLLAAGLSLAHYRVMVMAFSGVLVWMLVRGIGQRWSWRHWKDTVLRLTAAGSVAGGLTAPWWLHLIAAQQVGFSAGTSRVTAAAFALSRLGSDVLAYPTNLVVVGLALIAVVWGVWGRERLIIGLLIWAVTMMVASGPWLAGVFMDTVSVFVSLYIPVAVAIGWMLDRALTMRGSHWPAVRWASILALVLLAGQGVISSSSIVKPWAGFVTMEDLRAMEYIRTHLPVNARFMINTLHFEFLPELIIGTDAGQWLPLLADRDTVILPMAALSEHFAEPDYAGRVTILDQLDGRLTTAEALQRLSEAGVTHIYIGQRGGPIRSEDLLGSPAFRLEYHADANYVFAFLGDSH